jgi:hypothetical protein
MIVAHNGNYMDHLFRPKWGRIYPWGVTYVPTKLLRACVSPRGGGGEPIDSPMCRIQLIVLPLHYQLITDGYNSEIKPLDLGKHG